MKRLKGRGQARGTVQHDKWKHAFRHFDTLDLLARHMPHRGRATRNQEKIDIVTVTES